ncbi:hypothetical protein K5549_006504 [Capra hircus]|uniref:Rad60/SUMO-like domain-containing protein n=1 Tax=Capra hircus TaxID=9925 RepID=A0A452F2Z8_CAPHI|nr:hypothetical protein K5549_006504 [Capra hircus]
MVDKKPKEDVKTENSNQINLKVVEQDGSVIKRHTPCRKLINAYYLLMGQIRFQVDGQPINETDTPAQSKMEDKDTMTYSNIACVFLSMTL